MNLVVMVAAVPALRELRRAWPLTGVAVSTTVAHEMPEREFAAQGFEHQSESSTRAYKAALRLLEGSCRHASRNRLPHRE